MTLKKILHLSIYLICSHAFSQLGVGTSSPNPSAQLEVVSNNKGILIPRLALTTITDTATITEGNVESMLVYNTSSNMELNPGYYYWANGVWNRLAINTEISSLPKDVTSSNGSISGIADNAALAAMDLEVNVDGSTIEVNASNGVQVKNGGILTAKLADNAVTTAKINDNSITAAKVADGAITNTKVADAAITTAKVADGTITTVKVADDAITTAKISTLGAADANKVLGTDALGDPVWQVASANLGENVISSNGSISGIADDAALVAMDLEVNVDGSTIGVDATNGVQVMDGGILTAKLADNAVTTAKISDNSITTAKVADEAITTAKVADAAITTAKVADGTITTVKVADDAITTAKIGTLGAADANKVLGTDALGDPVWQVASASLGENVISTNGSISGIANDAALVAMDLEVNVDGSTIEVDATNGVQVKDGGILTAKLADNAVTTAKISDNSITTAKVADVAITTAKVADGTITTVKVADDAITTGKIGTLGASDANKVLGTDALGDPVWQVASASLGENVTSSNGSISGIANDAALVAMDLEVNVDGSTIEVDATNGVQVKDGGILTAKLADNTVTTAKISDNSITSAKVADGAITNTKVADGTITTEKVADNAITTAKIGTLGASDANKVLGTDALGDPVWQVASASLGENVTSSNGSISGIADDAALVAMDLKVNVDGSTIEVDATNGVQVKDGGILTAKLADNAVTTAKISDNSITSAKVADDAITSAKVTDDAITTVKISDNAVDGTKIQVTGEAAGSMLYNDGTDWVDFPKGTAGQYLKMNAAGTAPEWTTAPTSKRIGEFVFAKSGRTTSDGYLAVNPGTIANGAVLYPIWAAEYPEFVSGNDIVFPTNVAGMFLRNTGGNAASEGSYQGNATAIPTNNFTTNTTGNHNHTVYGDTAGNVEGSNSSSGDTVLYNGDGQNNNENTSSAGSHSHSITGGGDVETRPINRAYQLYTIVDTY